MSARHFLHSHWPSIAIAATAAAIAGVLLAMLWTLPPRSIVMATGPEGGDYYQLGQRYRAVLANDGVEVRLVPTAGSVNNLAMLRNRTSGVNVALMQGGVISAATTSGLESTRTAAP
jgi:TRAP-type uncharacterized transport system substrate-binding protein